MNLLVIVVVVIVVFVVISNIKSRLTPTFNLGCYHLVQISYLVDRLDNRNTERKICQLDYCHYFHSPLVLDRCQAIKTIPILNNVD